LAVSDTDNIANAELIKLAYSMAVEPQKLHMMQSIIDEKLRTIYDDAESNENGNQDPANLLKDVEVHFQNAMELMERSGRQSQSNSIATRMIDEDTQPAALVYPNGIILHTNHAAQIECGFLKGVRIADDIFDVGHHKTLMRDLKSLIRTEDKKFIGIYSCFSIDGERPFKLVLSKSEDLEGRTIGRISAMNVSWQESVGRQFQKTLGITPTEMDITRAVVSGLSLRDLAKQRGRSIGTLRNQMKRLLAKLDLSSKTELVTLYSGFSQINRVPIYKGDETPFGHQGWRQHFTFERASGLKMSYEVVGNDDGTPVLYLHPLIGGTGISLRMRAEIEKHNLKLIMPWRPHFLNTADGGPAESITERFAIDLEGLMDCLEIDQCPLMAGNEASVYGYAAGQYMPYRISGLLMTAGAIPLISREQFKAMGPHQRIPHFMARHAPGVINMYARSIMAMFDAGYDEEFVGRLFEDSPIDKATVLGDEIKPLARESVSYAFTQGYKSVSTELILSASKWGHLLDNINMPVTLVSGEQDSEFPVHTLENFVKERPNFRLRVVKEAGTFVIYQKPDIVFSELMVLINQTHDK